MDFYEQLSHYYDEIFAIDPEEMDFVKQTVEDCTRLIDVGCGTGNKTEFLAKSGRTIVGLDLDEDMIQKARAHHRGPGIEYRAGDMLSLGHYFVPGTFDGLICLGNTLVHLSAPGQAEAFAADAGRLVSPGGLAVIQILNYDHILDHQVSDLPLVETRHTIFRRRYEPRGALLGFQTRLEVRCNGIYEHEIPLRPIRRSELEDWLAADFTDLRFYGGYDGRPLQDDSLVLLLTARRR